jgi:subtilisin-like proprotein convertase family protein
LDPDTNAPTVPANLAASAAGPAEINLSWNSATDDVGVAGYLVERSEGAGSTNFTLIATPTGTNYSDTELTGATTYNYVVMATDAAGNLSGGTGVTATTPIPAPPTISVISNQTTLAGISAGPFPIYISDPGIDPSTLTITATSSNPTLVPDQNVFIFNNGLIQSLTIIPVAGQSGSSTITITVSNSVNSTNTSFLLTVNPPGGATDVFANTSNIVIPSLGTATPYPSTINVSGALGTITNLTVTLENMSHSNPGDVNVLLVGPGGQAVVLMSDTVGDNPMTNLTFTLSDQAYYPLPQPSPMLDGTFQPTDDAPNNTNSPYAFPLPAPAFPYSPNLGTFDGLSPNGTWSLYVYDGGTDDGGQISGGWSLAITTVLPTITTKSIQMTNSKSALITGIGAAGAVYTIQASTNLINWQRIGTATTGTNGVFSFKDSNTASFKSRFYRIMLP